MLFKLTLIFALLPNIGTTLIPSDTQPITFLLASFGLIRFWLNEGIKLYLLSIPFFIMLICAILSSFFFSSTLFSINQFRYFFGYVSPPIIIIYFLSQIHCFSKKDIAKVIDFSLYVIIFGVMLQILNLSSVVNLFVNRAIFSQGFESGRGFTSFFTEQAQFVSQMGLITTFYFLINKLNKKRLLIISLLIISSFAGHIIVLVFQTFLAAIATFLFSILIGQINIKKYFKLLLPIGASALSLFYLRNSIVSLFENLNLPVLGIKRIISLVEIGGQYIARDEGIIVKISGVFQTISSAIERPFAFYLGSSANPDFNSEIYITYSTLSQFVLNHNNLAFPLRLYSAMGNWIVDFGILGIASFLIFIIIMLNRIIKNSEQLRSRYLFCFFYLIQSCVMFIPLANPTIHTLSAFIFYNSKIKTNSFK